MPTVRTRFAPSPTGYMHLGNARAALFPWLYARKNNGVFVLRIEDTDPLRSDEACTKVILDTLEWIGMDYDEGPYYQTKRYDRYKEVAELLLKEGKAYKCYCSKERLDKLSDEQIARNETSRYDRHCRDSKEEQDGPYVIRLKNPLEGVVKFNDMVHGEIIFQNSELDDIIIARPDGSPTYNFCVAIDDYDMGITHVIRGDDHISNTPKQINVFKALGVEPPIFGHTPTILLTTGKRFSKRHGSVGVWQLREDGFLPQAILNDLVRLGWSHGDQEIFSIEELFKIFDFEHVNKAPAVFDINKLIWLNQHYMKTLPPEEVAKELKWHMEKQEIDFSDGPKLSDVVSAQAERCKNLKEMAEKSRYFYEDFETYDLKAADKNLKSENKETLEHILKEFELLESWKAEKLHEIIIKTAEKFDTKLGNVAQPIRVAVTGGTVSPPIDITLELLGKKRSLERLKKAVEFIK